MCYKNYLGALKSLVLIKLGFRIPIKVTHFITNNCNLNCCFCLAKDFKNEKEMTTKEIKDCMNEFKKAGTQLWDLSGGEPLLRKDILEVVEYAKKKGFMVSIATNGVFIKKNLEALLKTDYIIISLDGPKDVHDKIRRKPCFDIVIKNLDLLVKNNKIPIINMVINKDNLNYIDYMVEFTKEHKCYIDFSLVTVNREEINKYTLTRYQINDTIKKILKLKKQNPCIITSTFYLKRILNYYNNKIKKFQPNCLAGKGFCILSLNGEVALCIDRIKNGFDGKKDGFYNAFKKLKYPNCDCMFRCYYNTNNLYSLNPLVLVKALYNNLMGKWLND